MHIFWHDGVTTEHISCTETSQYAKTSDENLTLA